jgi:nuclear receptor subfamily 1 group I
MCPKDGDCPVTHIHRRFCKCCRLAKCFRVGMQKELILTEAQKETRRKLAARNREKQSKTESLSLVCVNI